jgi:hypothetical protein
MQLFVVRNAARFRVCGALHAIAQQLQYLLFYPMFGIVLIALFHHIPHNIQS